MCVVKCCVITSNFTHTFTARGRYTEQDNIEINLFLNFITTPYNFKLFVSLKKLVNF